MIDDGALKRIEELHRLQKEGIISAEEFERTKQDILFGGSATAHSVSIGTSPITRPDEDDWLAWMLLPIRRYAQFDGRSSRKEFWMFQLFYVLIVTGAVIIAALDRDDYGELGFFGKSTVGTLALALLGLVIPLIATQVRRFHDQNRSGWFAALNLIPYVGAFIVLVFMAFPGTKGDNRFGSDPARDFQ